MALGFVQDYIANITLLFFYFQFIFYLTIVPLNNYSYL